MGIWKSDLQSIIDTSELFTGLSIAYKQPGSKETFSRGFNALLREAIRESYQPREGEEKPSELDIKSASQIVVLRTAAYIALKHESFTKETTFLDSSFEPKELAKLKELVRSDSWHNPPKVVKEALQWFLQEDSDVKAAYRVYGDLLKVVDEDKIKAFGVEMQKFSGTSDVHMRAGLANLVKAGIIDNDTDLAMRKVFGGDCSMFVKYFNTAKDDIPAFASQTGDYYSKSTVNILWALAVDELNVLSALSYAVRE